MMKILIAPNALKGSLSASQTGAIIADFLKSKFPDHLLQVIPIADGGDGTCELLGHNLGLESHTCWTLDALGRSMVGSLAWDSDNQRAYLDVSTASGIGKLTKVEKLPRSTSTFGTGLLIKEAMHIGAKEIVLGLGGSATIDLGLGILQGLGFHFLSQNGRPIPPYSDQILNQLSHIQVPIPFSKIKFKFLCDVRNHLLGPQGAVTVFGPQKGLKPSEVQNFEDDLHSALQRVYAKTNVDFVDQAGFGAAGGIAAGLSAFFDTEIEFGSSFFFDQVGITREVKNADLVITAEGRYDSQSMEGKACYELLKICRQYNKPSVLISSGNEGSKAGFTQFVQLPDLNFQHTDWKNEAKQNLLHSLDTIRL